MSETGLISEAFQIFIKETPQYSKVWHAKSMGASREEIIGAVLIGLPAVGHRVIHALPAALEAYDKEKP